MYRQPEKIDKAFYDEGKGHFTEAQIMELGGMIALHYGMAVFMRTMQAGPKNDQRTLRASIATQNPRIDWPRFADQEERTDSTRHQGFRPILKLTTPHVVSRRMRARSGPGLGEQRRRPRRSLLCRWDHGTPSRPAHGPSDQRQSVRPIGEVKLIHAYVPDHAVQAVMLSTTKTTRS